MKFYLSSYKIGNCEEEFKKMISSTNMKTAYISNALDFTDDLERRKESEENDINDLREFGLSVERLDLKEYFNQKERLKEKIMEYGVIWVRGGNTFVLRQAMKLSGFDEILLDIQKNNNLVYGGYSAGVCVLGPNLRGLEIVDDVNIFPYKEIKDIIWEGVGVLNYSIVPHYRSDHPESEKVEEVVAFMIKEKILFKVLKDGEVITLI
jgi:dipeptidase E